MWVAVFVALLASGEHGTAVSDDVFTTREACELANAKVEALIKSKRVEALKLYGLTCVEVELKGGK